MRRLVPFVANLCNNNIPIIIGYLDFADNHFVGPVDFGEKLDKIVTLSAINLTNNNFSGTFPCLKNNFGMQYIDIRQTKFNKIDTNNCIYNKSLKYFLASFNPHLTQNFSQITQSFSNNMTILAFGVTNVWGDVSRSLIENGGQYIALYDTDIATRYYQMEMKTNHSLNFSYNNYHEELTMITKTNWSQAWVIIGVTVSGPLPSFINEDERQLKMVLVPKNDFITYAIIPIGCTIVAFLVYIVYFSKYSHVISLSKYLKSNTLNESQIHDIHTQNQQSQHKQPPQKLRIGDIQSDNNNKIETTDETDAEKQKRLSKTFHRMMATIHKFLWSLLLLLNGPLIIVYYLGSNWVNPGQGFTVLRISAAYLGSHEENKWNQFLVATALALCLVYSWVCAFFSISIMKRSKLMSQTICQLNNSNFENNTNRNSTNKKNNKNDNNVNVDDESMESSLIAQDYDIVVKHGLGYRLCLFFIKSIVFISFLMFFILFLTFPIGLYNLYHSLPTKNSLPFISRLENDDNYQIISYIIENFTSLVISLQQWFLITPCVDILIVLFPFNTGIKFTTATTTTTAENINVNNIEMEKISTSYYHKNFMVQLFRNLTFIIIPLCCLFYFDDKSLQNWKQFWPSCDSNSNGTYALGSPNNKACEQLPAFYWSNTKTTVCFDICSTQYVFYSRCARQIFQVLGPLYTIKATIGLIFPLIYHINTRFEITNRIKHIFYTCLYYICHVICKKEKQRKYNRNNCNNKYDHSLDIECIGLISSLEILIVFGWALPILIPIYNVIML